MIGFDLVVRIWGVDVVGGGCQLGKDPRVARRPVGVHLDWPTAVGQGSGEQPAGRGEVPLFGGDDVDDLADLVDRPVQVGPPAGHFHLHLVDKPPIGRAVPAGPGRLDQQPGEPAHPPIHGHVIHDDATCGEQLLDVPGGPEVAQLPAHRHNDHLGWEAEPGELRGRNRRAGRRRHPSSLPDQ